MKLNSEIRRQARESLRDNWGQPVLATFIFMLIMGVVQAPDILGAILFEGSVLFPLITIVLALLILPLSYGYAVMFIDFIRGDKNEMTSKMFSGFQNFSRSFGVMFMVGLYTFLWALLLIVPGIIKGYSYMMTYYIAKDNPDMSIDECINASMKMMDGNKWRLFKLHFSFIGWGLLCLLTLGLGLLLLYPYVYTAQAHFYEELKAEQATVQLQ